jgi:hypothetical protein
MPFVEDGNTLLVQIKKNCPCVFLVWLFILVSPKFVPKVPFREISNYLCDVILMYVGGPFVALK